MLKTIDHKIDLLKLNGIRNLPQNPMIESLVFQTKPYNMVDMIDSEFMEWEIKSGGYFKLDED